MNVCATEKDNKEPSERALRMKKIILEERKSPRSIDKVSLVIHGIEDRSKNVP